MNDKSESGLRISMAISGIILLLGIIYLAFTREQRSAVERVESLRRRCESTGGVYIEGTSGPYGGDTQFSLCIPERAFECIDAELVDVE